MRVMLNRSHALSSAATGRIALAVIAIAAAACLANPSPVKAQSADLVLCDRLAADPSDPDKPADVKGTSDVAPSDVATAIKYCRIAGGFVPGPLCPTCPPPTPRGRNPPAVSSRRPSTHARA